MELDDEDELLHEQPGMRIYSENGKAAMYIVDIIGNKDALGPIGVFKNELCALAYFRSEFSE